MIQRRSLLWLAATAYVLGAAWAALRRAREIPQSDFQVFWDAGRRFMDGAPLYPVLPIDVSFLYPPFAAWTFQGLSLFAPSTAAGAFHFVNLLLWPVILLLTALILRTVAPEWWRSPWPVILAALCTARFFLWNLHWNQVNEVTLVLVLLGIWAVTRGRDGAAALAFMAATFLKIVPGVFLVWLVMRGRRRALIAFLPAALTLLLVPLLWRGLGQGAQDLADYYTRFLAEYLGGGVRVRHDNGNLASLVYGFFVPLHHPEVAPRSFLLPGGVAVAARLYYGAALLVAGSYLAALFRRRRRRLPIDALEISATFLVGLLLSGVTWNHHFVALVFVAATFFLYPRQRAGRPWSGLVLVVWALLVLQGAAGRDTMPTALYDWLQLHMTLGWTVLYLFVLSLLLPTLQPAPAVRTEPAPAEGES